MEWSPATSWLVVKLAEEFTTGTLASTCFPSVKVTVPPVAWPPKAGVTTAVNVTASVTVCGFEELVRFTALCESTTTSRKTGDCEPTKLASPAYAAVKLWDPSARLDRVKIAFPRASRGDVPND